MHKYVQIPRPALAMPGLQENSGHDDTTAYTTFVGGSKSWPLISEIEREYQFDNPSQAAVELVISDQEGTPKYKLECHNHLYDVGNEFTYSGEVDRSLGAGNKINVSFR